MISEKTRDALARLRTKVGACRGNLAKVSSAEATMLAQLEAAFA